MASNNDFDHHGTERDLYAILHIDRNADSSTIQQAYRHLSLLFHPDKHIDERNKQFARDLFIQVKQAYDILNDPDKRAIYDALGMKGLRTEGWEIVARTRTTRELVDEYERLARDREERQMNQRTNANGSVNMTFNLTDLFKQLNSMDETKPFSPKIQIAEISVEQSMAISVRTEDTITIDATVSKRKQQGSGSLSTSFRHILPDLSWFRIDLIFAQRPQMGLRYVRSLTRKLQASVATTFVFIPHHRALLSSGLICSVSYPLSSHFGSSLQWKVGQKSFMKGTLHYDNQIWSLSSAVNLGLMNTFGAIDGVYRFLNICNLRFSLKLFVFGPWFEYGIDRQITKYTHGSATVAISARLGVLLRLKFQRGSQTFTFPLQLSREILPSAIFYATILPPLAYLIIDRYLIQPYAVAEEVRREKQRDNEANERRREAMNAQELLRSAADEVKEREGPQGLIILEGYYGYGDRMIDVTVPLQALVKNGSLRLDTRVSKSNLTGFYDPCSGQEKTLKIKYLIRSRIHTVIYQDTDAISLPIEDLLIP